MESTVSPGMFEQAQMMEADPDDGVSDPAELSPQSDRAQLSKRRSIFRSAGTSSTPDLTQRNKASGQATLNNMPSPSQESNGTRALVPPSTVSKGNQGSSEFLSSPVRTRPGPLGAEEKPVHPGNRDRAASHGPAVVQSSSQMSGGTQRSTNTLSSKSNGLQSPRGSTVTNRTSTTQGDDGNKVGFMPDQACLLIVQLLIVEASSL